MLAKILIDIYKDKLLSNVLGFKGGTAAMFFYNLPRISVDLDFDLIKSGSKIGEIYEENATKIIITSLKKILKKHGEISYLHEKHYTILGEIIYEKGESRLKIEISKRKTSDKYKIINYFGENIIVMDENDLFTNKLIALLNRKGIANRDIFDIRFFLSKSIDINEVILKNLTGLSKKEYLLKVKNFINDYNFNKILYGLGELLDPKMKNFAKSKMKDQIVGFLEIYLN